MIWKGVVYSVWEQLLCFEKETFKRGFKVLDAAMSNHQMKTLGCRHVDILEAAWETRPFRACTANSGSTGMSLAKIVIGFGQYTFFIKATSLY